MAGVSRGLGLRFIPRRLGRGVCESRAPYRPPVHPQATGERGSTGGAIPFCRGSSPGDWGEDAGVGPRRRGRRFIPRRLGRGGRCGGGTAPTPVHPQATGERAVVEHLDDRLAGSSPGDWGEAGRRDQALCRPRFIPRRLGRGTWAPRRPPSSSVHPQATGERVDLPVSASAVCGSSPGDWGEAGPEVRRRARRRFIPRRLGRGSRSASTRSAIAVHPQATGERSSACRSSLAALGSSPGDWGEVAEPVRHLIPRRFIPRRLGRGPLTLADMNAPPVHPQATGERGLDDQIAACIYGSSPGDWGEGDLGELLGVAVRFIPRRLGRGDGRP